MRQTGVKVKMRVDGKKVAGTKHKETTVFCEKRMEEQLKSFLRAWQSP